MKKILYVIGLITIVMLTSCGDKDKSNNDKSESTTSIAEKVTLSSLEKTSEVSTMEITSEIISTTEETSELTTQIYFDTSIKGRGDSEENAGRSEPNYVGKYGYAASYSGYLEKHMDTVENIPWSVPTYSKVDADHYEESGSIPHKTVIKVISQDLEHEGWGNYSGYLNVQNVETNEEYIIGVVNFITNDYWNFDDVTDIFSYGNCLAEYHQTSEYLPVDRKNEIVNLQDGQLLLIKGKTDLFSSDGPDSDVRQVACYVLNGAESNTDYSSENFFNSEDVKIIY